MQIYKICNKKNGKIYIGKTKFDFKRRYHGGKWWKWTHSYHLKNAVRKYGLENFEIEIIYESDSDTEEKMLELEAFYICKYNCFVPGGYNLTRGGGSPNQNHYKNYDLVDKNGNTYAVKNLSKFCWDNNLNYNAMLSMVSGSIKSSQGYALKGTPTKLISTPRRRHWFFENIKTGEISHVEFGDVKKWCLERDIPYKSFKGTLSSGKSLNGWKLLETDINSDKFLTKKERNKRKYNAIEIFHKDGRKFIINDINEFIRLENIKGKYFYKMLRGEIKTSFGWSLHKRLERKNTKSKLKIWNILELSTNIIFEVKNITEFTKERGLNHNNFWSMISGKILQYQGYTLVGRNLKDYSYPKKIIYIKLVNQNSEILEGSSPRNIERNYSICSSQTLYDIIRGKAKNLINGWSIVFVKYLNGYYPDWTPEIKNV